MYTVEVAVDGPAVHESVQTRVRKEKRVNFGASFR